MHNESQIEELLSKIDDVCGECLPHGDDCERCNVRKLTDQLYNEMRRQNKAPITATDIKRGVLLGLVRLIDKGGETVCMIGGLGGNWFYFGGMAAEAEGPWDYVTHMDFDEIVEDIVKTLAGLHDSDYDEWCFYRSVLDGN